MTDSKPQSIEGIPECDELTVRCVEKLSGGLERYECGWTETFELRDGDVEIVDGKLDFSDEFHERTGMFKCGTCRNTMKWEFNGVRVSGHA